MFLPKYQKYMKKVFVFSPVLAVALANVLHCHSGNYLSIETRG